MEGTQTGLQETEPGSALGAGGWPMGRVSPAPAPEPRPRPSPLCPWSLTTLLRVLIRVVPAVVLAIALPCQGLAQGIVALELV